jgi:amino acid transporter
MGIYEIGLLIYLSLWLLALFDAAIGRFSHWYYQLIWLIVIFLVPFGNLAYLLFGCRQVVDGGLRILHKQRNISQGRKQQ